MLEQPKKAGNKVFSHVLSSHGGKCKLKKKEQLQNRKYIVEPAVARGVARLQARAYKFYSISCNTNRELWRIMEKDILEIH